MTEREPFFEALAAEQDAIRGRSSAKARLLERIDALPPPRANAASRRVPWALAAAAACVMVVSGVWFVTRERPLEVRVGSSARQALVGAWLGAPDDEPLRLEFSDGTRIELGPRARARVRQVRSDGAHLELGAGRMRLHVTPRRGAHWRLDVGPFGVQVTGTQFDVSYSKSDDHFELTLEEGEVILHGCVFGGGRKLAPGQTVRASCRTPSLEIGYGRASAAPPPNAPLDAPVTTTAEPNARPTEVPKRTETSPSEPKSASAEELLLLADAARRTGGSARAAEALRDVRARFPGSRAAALAAFKLGRLEFDGNGAYGRAAEWFQTYLREDPGGPMTREALGRLLESFERAGARARAKEFALRYRREYPSGPHAELAARIAASP
jgi:hypothetical protein